MILYLYVDIEHYSSNQRHPRKNKQPRATTYRHPIHNMSVSNPLTTPIYHHETSTLQTSIILSYQNTVWNNTWMHLEPMI